MLRKLKYPVAGAVVTIVVMLIGAWWFDSLKAHEFMQMIVAVFLANTIVYWSAPFIGRWWKEGESGDK